MPSNYCPECGTHVDGEEGDACSDCDGETWLCGRPCDPANNSECCREYWQRMRAEGLWDDRTGWTATGVRAMKVG